MAIVNTGDDHEFYGVHVSPDLDIVTYTLAGRVDPERGYGLAGDSFAVIDALGALGHQTWFRLGDRDLATCLHRTLAPARGRRPRRRSRTSSAARSAWRRASCRCRRSPARPTCGSRAARASTSRSTWRATARPTTCAASTSGGGARAPAPGVLEAIAAADAILLCPSNPVVSIGPILAVPGVRDGAPRERARPSSAISPIVGGAPVKGPADRLLRGIGVEVSARGVAALYRGLAHGFVIDERDAAQAGRRRGARPRVPGDATR